MFLPFLVKIAKAKLPPLPSSNKESSYPLGVNEGGCSGLVPPGGSKEAVTLCLPEEESTLPYLLDKSNLNNNSVLIRNKGGYKEATTFF